MSKSRPRPSNFTPLTWKCASHHNGVHFFNLSTCKSALNVVCCAHFKKCFAPQRRAIFHLWSGQMAPHPCFSEPPFRPSGAINHWKKHSESRLSYLFAHLHLLFFSHFPFSDLLPSSLLLSDSSHLCFSICPYCPKFDFKTSFHS